MVLLVVEKVSARWLFVPSRRLVRDARQLVSSSFGGYSISRCTKGVVS
jgi:hypothetical protein